MNWMLKCFLLSAITALKALVLGYSQFLLPILFLTKLDLHREIEQEGSGDSFQPRNPVAVWQVARAVSFVNSGWIQPRNR